MSELDNLMSSDAYDEGFAAGFEKGCEQYKEFLLKKLKMLGYSIKEIEKILG